MTLKKFIETGIKSKIWHLPPGHLRDFVGKVTELDNISHWFAIMYGVELKINVEKVPIKEGRNLGIGVVEELWKTETKKPNEQK